MSSFRLDEREQSKKFAGYLKGLEERIASLERSNPLTNASIEGGSLDVYDDEGTLRAQIGVQDDGTVALAPLNSQPPPTPAEPAVDGTLAGLVVAWDGTWADAEAAPADFSLVQVHVGPAPDFVPDLSTLAATITAPLGGAATIAVEGYSPVWVRLVASNTAAMTGPPSTAVEGTPRQAVGQDILDGIIDETKLAESAVTEAKIALGAVGTTALADGAVLADKLAKAAVTLGKIDAGAVTLNALGGAASDLAAQRYVDTMADPAAWAVLAKAPTARWDYLSGITDARTGQTVAQATGHMALRGTVQIAYDPEVLYRVSARVRTTAATTTGTDSLYIGVLGVAADGVTLVNRAGANTHSSQHYCAASATAQPAGGWVTYTGYVKGLAAPGAQGSGGVCPDPRSPGVTHSDVRFISPMLWLNYGAGGASGSGVMQVDAVTVEALKTGVVDGTNLVVGSVATAHLATDAVTAGKVAADAISAREILANAIGVNELAANSVTANAVAAGAVTVDKLTIVGAGNILADPSFEGVATAAIVAPYDWATQDKTFGNGSASSLQLNTATGTALSRSLAITYFPVTSGDQVYLATDYYASADWAGAEISLQIRWELADGSTVSFDRAGTTTPVRGAWTRLTATVPAPPTAVVARVRVESRSSTAGKVWFDNAVVRPVVPGVQIADGAITAPKILAGAVTTDKLLALAVTAEKIASLAITTDKLNALSVTADKLAVNSVTATKIMAGVIDATHIKAGAIDAERLALGVDGNLVADPSFEGETSVIRAAASPYFSIDSPGFDSPKSFRIDCTSTTKVSRIVVLGRVPAVPGTKVYVSLDYKTSPDWNGTNTAIYVRWEDAAGAFLGYSVIYSDAPGPANTGGAWRRLSGLPTDAAPAGAVRGTLSATSNTASVGTVWLDNAIIRPIMANGSSGARAELSPLGLTLFDDIGEEAVSLMTGRPNYLTLATDGTPVATIDQDGNAGFQNLAVADLTVGGDPLTTLLNTFPRGIIAIDYQASGVTTSGATEMGFVELAFTAEADRMYRVVFDAYADPELAGGELAVILRDGGTGAPLISSAQINSGIYPMTGSGPTRVHLEDVRHGAAWGPGDHRLLISFRVQGGPTGQSVRLYGAEATFGFFYVEDVGPRQPETGGYNSGGASTPPSLKKYTRTYSATWSGSYASRGSYNSFYGNKMMCGYYSSTNGVQASLVGFSSALSSDLAGATILKAEVYLYFDHWAANAGGKAVIKAHKHSSRPSSFSSDSEAKTVSWARNEGKWVDITSVFDSTAWRGIALDPNSTSSTYYGRARGVGQSSPPRLRVTYTK